MQTRRVQLASLALILALAAVLRLYNLADLPAGFFCDEAGLGYNAHTIATEGSDENGNPFPLFFWSFGVSYKNPAFVYAAALPVKLLGASEFSVRLTSALFGIGTVAGMFLLGRALMGPWVGFFAALLLAVTPWHIHFSRIAFELIAFPFFFVFGFYFFVRYTQGRRTLPAAMFCFGLCFYAYAIANLFVPLFVIGATLLFLPSFFRRFGHTLLALLVLLATVAPVGMFYYDRLGSTGSQYFRNTTHLQEGEPLDVQASRTWGYYQQFFSQEFLFRNGDPIVRHAVRGHGELYKFFLPLLLLGGLAALLKPDRVSKLALWWLALYPVGASLMTEIPSASRGFIGAPAFALLAGIGAATALRLLSFVLRWRPLVLTAQTAAVAAGAYFAVPEVQSYLHDYFVEYPKYSAWGYGGFQYGYRDAIQYMESRRKDYDLLLMTAVEVNQPQVFPQFYNALPAGKPLGYLIVNPAEFGRYSPDQRILAALRPGDLDLFSDFDVHKEIVAPGGQVEFIVAEIRARKRFLTDWLVLGLFDNDDLKGIERDPIDVTALRRDRYQGAFGEVYWRRITPQFVLVDLNIFFSRADPRYPGNPERVCAYAALTVQSDTARDAFLEISGSDDVARLWLNGRSLTPFPIALGEGHMSRPISLAQGDNLLVLKTCENVGGWSFKARITDAAGKDISGIRTAPEIPDNLPNQDLRLAAESQLVEGFAKIISFRHRQETHADYRGAIESWWAYVHDQLSEVVWQTAPVTEKKATVFAFTGSTSNEEGKAELFVNGKYALTFDLGPDRGLRQWQRGAYRLTFVPKVPVAGNSGIFVLSVPADDITPGEPVTLRVLPSDGKPEAWFALKAYTDTINHESLNLERALDALEPGFRDPAAPAPAAQPEQPKPRDVPVPTPSVQAAATPEATIAPAEAEAEAEAKAKAKAKAEAEVEVEHFAYRGEPAPIAGDSASVGNAVVTDGRLELSLDGETDLESLGAIVEGVELGNEDGAWFPADGTLAIPDAGAAVGREGAISFWVEPTWDGTAAGDHSLVQLRDPQRWENRIQIFKNGEYLRFLFTDGTGTESGVGTNIKSWAAGDRHHVTATWADGMTYLYVDGVLAGTNPYSGQLDMPPSTDLYLGSDHKGGLPGAEAIMSQFEAIDRELTADDVGARYGR